MTRRVLPMVALTCGSDLTGMGARAMGAAFGETGESGTESGSICGSGARWVTCDVACAERAEAAVAEAGSTTATSDSGDSGDSGGIICTEEGAADAAARLAAGETGFAAGAGFDFATNDGSSSERT